MRRKMTAEVTNCYLDDECVQRNPLPQQTIFYKGNLNQTG